MRGWSRLGVVIGLAMLLFVAIAAAQDTHQCPCQGAFMTHRYDAAAEVTFAGAVTTIDEHQCPMRDQKSLHVVVKGDAGERLVHVGPLAYVSEQGFAFAKGDTVEIVGSPLKCGDTDALVAREIRKGGKTLALRDAQGTPKWAPRGPRGHHPHDHGHHH